MRLSLLYQEKAGCGSRNRKGMGGFCDKYNLPRMVYVTEMDMDDASFRNVVEELTARYGKVIAPHFQPIRENEQLVGYVNVIKNAARRYTGIGQREECEIPDYCLPNLKIYRDTLLETVAETSEDLMERYFAGEEFSVEEIRSALRVNVMDGSVVPVGMGSNTMAQGVANLLSDIVRFFPSPDKRECVGLTVRQRQSMKQIMTLQKAKTAMSSRPCGSFYRKIFVCQSMLWCFKRRGRSV